MLAQLNGHCIDGKIFLPTTIKSHVVKIVITWSISPPKTITLDWSIDIYVSITRSKSLGWESLQHRRYTDRLSMLFRIQHGLVDVTTDYIQPNDTRTRGSQRLRQLQATKDVYKYSFYPRTISDWNRLPTTVTDVQTPGI